MVRGGDLVARSLIEYGVDKLFTVPGESFLPLLDGLLEVSDRLQVIPTRHEEGAAFAAEAYAKASGRLGVVAVTRGVGATHAAIAIHTAHQDATPMLVLVGQVPTSNKGREAFQELTLELAFAGLAKWSIEIASAERVPELMAQAIRTSTSGRPGPVIVGLPEDILYDEVANPKPTPRISVESPSVSSDVAEHVAHLFAEAERPAVIAGREVLSELSTDRLVSFAESYQLPVYTAFRRFDAFPNTHPNYAGNIALGTPRRAIEGIYEADLVVMLGDRFDEISAHGYRLNLDNSDLIHVASDAALIGTWGARVTGVVSSTRGFLAAADAELDELTVRERSTWVQKCNSAFEDASAVETPFPSEFPGVNISAVMESIRRLGPDSTAIVTDAGNFSAWVSRYYRFTRPRTHFGPISGAMGYAMPGSVGVATADPSRPVVALAGDGGFAMTMNELAVAKANGLHIIVLVFVNHLLGTIRMHQEKHFPDRHIATDLVNPSFASIAEAFGVRSTRAHTNEDVDRALAQAFAEHSPMLIEVIEGKERLAAWGKPIDTKLAR